MTFDPSTAWHEPFQPEDSLGAQAPEVIDAFLREIGDYETADSLKITGGAPQGSWPFYNKPSLNTGVAYGFIETATSSGRSRIIPGPEVEADRGLAGSRIKVTLDHFHAAHYPGIGDARRKILCEFEGRNQIPGASEPIHFASTLSVRNGDSAGVSGLPLFLGLTVGRNGIQFMGRTILVGSTVDDALIGVFENDLYKKGLSLLSTAQPALAPLVLTAGHVIRFLLKSNKNKEMHSFQMGFDFDGSSTSPRLRLGSYVIVQCAGQREITLTDFHWDRGRNRIRPNAASEATVDFNYMVFGISQFDDELI